MNEEHANAHTNVKKEEASNASQHVPWHQITLADAKVKLNTDFKKGLDKQSALNRFNKNGPNAFDAKQQVLLITRILNEFKSPLVVILGVAGIATVFLHEYVDAIVIGLALLINLIIGLVQEGRASKAFEKLQSSQDKFATVIRDGRKTLIPAINVVVGDVLVIEAGMYVSADTRLFECRGLAMNEAVLTGEWASVEKDIKECHATTPIAEQSNMIWMGTFVAGGFGTGVVTAVGNDTQVGLIAKSLSDVETSLTPVQLHVKKLARFLAIAIFAIILLIFALGLVRGEAFGEMLLLSIAIAVAVVPAGLPAAVTVVLALGMEAILKKGGLVRNLLAAETLGSTTVIITDKTGTLTEARMKLTEIYTLDAIKNKNADSDDNKAVLKMAVLASDAFIEFGVDSPEDIKVRGGPIDSAIVLAGLDASMSQDELLLANERIDHLKFESSRRYAVSLNKIENSKKRRIHIIGAPEVLLDKSELVFKNGKAIKISKETRDILKRTQDRKSSQSMRLVGIAYKDVLLEKIEPELLKNEQDVTASVKDDVKEERDLFHNIVFVGFLAFVDPIRVDVASAVGKAKSAGARVIMLTGDNAQTAKAIAMEAGIADESDVVITGDKIEKLTDDELGIALKSTKVFARALPSHKLRISRILKNMGEVVAMTGDGVNDAPALLSADIGVAVGSGTEVAKESSDLVLLDNSFSIIVDAIEEGRRIIDNLKKIVAYLLSTSFSEVFVISAALLIGGPIPLLATQILWINIIEEGFMNFAFAFEKKEDDLMERNPRIASKEGIINSKLLALISVVGVVTGFILVGLYLYLLKLNLPIDELRTFMFVALSIDSIFFSFSLKNLHKPIWSINILSNKYLLLALALSITMLLSAMFIPFMQQLLSLVPLGGKELLALFGIGILNLITIEIAKYGIFEFRRYVGKKD